MPPTPGAIDDSDLAAVVATWPALPGAIRRAVMALVGTVADSTTTETPPDDHGSDGFGDGAGGER
ncbi:MAG: hypothetical protein D6744_03965 [Planctomycetota bacterium]|nr:MAG: hypothetical protein D6744_03965 [Planctomycetota bacterium]